MNPNPNIEKLQKDLGLPSAPLVTKNIHLVSDYFTSTLKESPFNWISYLKGIDFHKSVEQLYLNPGLEIARHKPEFFRVKPFLYFTDIGSSPMRTGTNFPQVTFERFRVTAPISALKSIASSIFFDASDRISRPGGAVQYIIP